MAPPRKARKVGQETFKDALKSVNKSKEFIDGAKDKIQKLQEALAGHEKRLKTRRQTFYDCVKRLPMDKDWVVELDQEWLAKMRSKAGQLSPSPSPSPPPPPISDNEGESSSSDEEEEEEEEGRPSPSPPPPPSLPPLPEIGGIKPTEMFQAAQDAKFEMQEGNSFGIVCANIEDPDGDETPKIKVNSDRSFELKNCTYEHDPTAPCVVFKSSTDILVVLNKNFLGPDMVGNSYYVFEVATGIPISPPPEGMDCMAAGPMGCLFDVLEAGEYILARAF
jgi:hypothetical protein